MSNMIRVGMADYRLCRPPQKISTLGLGSCLGVINLRGEVVPVMSLRKRFGLEADEYTGATRIIILKLKDQSMIGVIVDEVKEVVNLDPETIEKPNFKLDESNASYLTGIGKSGENLISLLNIENVVGETKTA